MTVWKPDFDPTTEIYSGESTNGSGYKIIRTGFRQILAALPIVQGSSYPAVQVTGLTVKTSSNIVEIFVQCSAGGLLNVSTPFDMVVRGLRG